MDIIAPTQADKSPEPAPLARSTKRYSNLADQFSLKFHSTPPPAADPGSRVAETAHPTLHLPISKTGGAGQTEPTWG